jgi:hypothetical protein
MSRHATIKKSMYATYKLAGMYPVNPALLASSFAWQIRLSLLHISLFKVFKRKYFSQSLRKCIKFVFMLLDNNKILTL